MRQRAGDAAPASKRRLAARPRSRLPGDRGSLPPPTPCPPGAPGSWGHAACLGSLPRGLVTAGGCSALGRAARWHLLGGVCLHPPPCARVRACTCVCARLCPCMVRAACAHICVHMCTAVLCLGMCAAACECPHIHGHSRALCVSMSPRMRRCACSRVQGHDRAAWICTRMSLHVHVPTRVATLRAPLRVLPLCVCGCGLSLRVCVATVAGGDSAPRQPRNAPSPAREPARLLQCGFLHRLVLGTGRSGDDDNQG